MAASTSDLLKKTGASTVTTLAAPGKALSVTSITVGSTTNYPTDTGIVIAIRVVDSSGELVAGTYTEWSATVTSGTTLAIEAAPVYGSDQVYAAGSTTQVYIPLSSYAHNKLVDAVLVEHKQTGAHAAVTADSLTLNGVAHEKTLINAPQGFLINGKISRTVATNDITVAIKTLAGADPSATDPVYCRIGDTVRSITSALSATVNDGTNWFGHGASFFATNEQDYFVYLIWNTTDAAVGIAFGAEPWFTTFADVSGTTTNHQYLAYSGSAPASTNEMEVVGRFNATLSATASFNWSVPATSIVINRPIFETRVLTYTNTGTGAGTASYYQVGPVKRIRCLTGSATSTSTSPVTQTLNFPTGYFSVIEGASGGLYAPTSVANQYGNLNSVNTSSATVYLVTTSGTGTARSFYDITGR